MSVPRRKSKLVIHDKDVDLTVYSKEIIDTINEIAPNKSPKVFKNYFSTLELTRAESIQIGQKLSKIPGLKDYGVTITTFRLFEGKLYESETSNRLVNKKKKITSVTKSNNTTKGGLL